MENSKYRPPIPRPKDDSQQMSEAEETQDEDEPRDRASKRMRMARSPTTKVSFKPFIQPASGDLEVVKESSAIGQEVPSEEQVTISQLQGEIQSKQLTSHVSTVEKGALQSLHKKVKEYQIALGQRDHMIGQLQTRLAETIQQRDELFTSSQDQAETFKLETETLRLQLQEAIDMVANQKTGINPRDHLDLKNKLISLQQNRAQDELTIKELSEQLQHKTEVHGQLDYKYKQILQKYKVMQTELQTYKTSNTNLESEIQSLQLKSQQLEDQQRNLEETVQKVQKERDAAKDENKKSRDEIQALMQRLQELASEVNKKEEEKKINQASAEEHLGQQLTLIKQQMSDLHAEEISKIKKNHETEIIHVTQEIDHLQHAQEETQTAMMENISSLNNQNLILKEQLQSAGNKVKQLDSEKELYIKKCSDLEAEIQAGHTSKGSLESEIKHLKVTCEELVREKQDWLSEKEVLNNEIQNMELLRTKVAMLEEEVDARLKSENKCKQLSEENDLLKMKCANLQLEREEYVQEEKIKLEKEITRRMEADKLGETLKEEREKLNLKLQQEAKLKADLESNYDKLKAEHDQEKMTNLQLISQISELENEKKTHDEMRNYVLQLETQNKKMEEIYVSECRLLNEKIATMGETHKEETEKLNFQLQQELKLKSDFESNYDQLKTENEQMKLINMQLLSQIAELENEKKNLDEIRNYIIQLETQYKKMEEEYVSKCKLLNEKITSMDEKLAEAHQLHLEFDAATRDNVSLKKTLDDVLKSQGETEMKFRDIEKEYREISEKCENMEKDKVEIEMERDKLMEQYRMMEAELASTRMALDREVQLTMHRKLSDIGLSLTRKFENISTQTDDAAIPSTLQGDTETVKGADVSDSAKNMDECRTLCQQDPQVLRNKIRTLEKANKDLLNENEKLNMSVQDFKFAVRSYENERSKLKRRLQEMEVDIRNFRVEQQKYHKELLEKVKYQKQVAELKLQKNMQEQNLRQQEENVRMLLDALKDVGDEGLGDAVTNTIRSVGSSFSKLQLKESCNTSHLRELLDPSLELNSISEELKEAFSCLVNLLDRLDRLHEEKLHIELENITLKSKVRWLHFQRKITENEKEDSKKDTQKPCEYNATHEDDYCLLEKELQTYKFENEKLNRCLERERLLLKLEKQKLHSPKIQIHSIMHGMKRTVSEPQGVEECIDLTMKFLRQAILKVISSQYIHTLSKTLAELEDAIKSAFCSLSSEIHRDLPRDELESEKLNVSHADDVIDGRVSMFTVKVEQLINVRTTLVDAANELVEQLEEAVSIRMAPLKLELENLLKSFTSEVGKPPLPVTGELKAEPSQAFLQEFVEVTTSICEEAQAQKLQILESQKALIQKILEDNKGKLNALCQQHLSNLNNVENISDAIKGMTELVAALELALSEEVTWVDQQYKELLRQYSHEQKLLKESHANKLKELENDLAALLKNAPQEAELAKLKEEHAAEIKRLETHISLQDNEMLGHLQGLYSDRDWYRRTVGHLSHVTLQLLHYYSVAESLTHKPQSPHPILEVQEQNAVQQPESISGRVLDLSFLSENKGDSCSDNQLSIFPEDNAVSVGLIGKSVQGDHSEELEIASNSGSLLDSTVMSEGLLDDLDKDEQVRSFLTQSYPQLMSILKGRWDRVVVECLEREVQELTISLQASAGMLKIFMHSVCPENQNLPTHISGSVNRSDYVKESSQEANKSSFIGAEPSDVTDESSLLFTKCGDPVGAEQVQTSQLRNNIILDLTTILIQEESVLNLTNLKAHELENREKLKAALKQLCQMAERTENLQLEIHHQKGIIDGLNEEINVLQDENNSLDHYSRNLAMELQATKDQLADYELESENKKRSNSSSFTHAAKMEASKDIKERVRTALSTKSKAAMNHDELVTRNTHLERLLETVVQDCDKEIESLKLQVEDLSQQLEVADRQLRSSRQFLDEQASEREREVEDLMREKEKLSSQLREKELILSQNGHLEKEVENLERELREKTQECSDALKRTKDLEAEKKAAYDKIQDLRAINCNLETDIEARCLRESQLSDQNESLNSLIEQFRQQNRDLKAKLKELGCEGELSKVHTPEEEVLMPHLCHRNTTESEPHDRGHPLSVELLESDEHDDHLLEDQNMVIEEYLSRITQCISTLLLLDVSVSQSDEDLSERGHLEMPSPYHSESGHGLSPAPHGQTLEEKLTNLECTAEAAVKRARDMQLTEKNLRIALEEVTMEKNLLQEKLVNHLMEIAKLEARLDEVRISEHPQSGEMRQKIAKLKEELEYTKSEKIKKCLENEELKCNLQSTKSLLAIREAELEKLNMSSHGSAQLEEDIKRLFDDIEAKDVLIETLKKERIQAPTVVSEFLTSLAQNLIDDKNAEIDNYIQQISNVKTEVKNILEHLKADGLTEDIFEQLCKIAAVKASSVDKTVNNDTEEILRKDSTQDSCEALSNMSIYPRKDLSPAPCEESKITQGSQPDVSLLSMQPEPPAELSKCSQASQTEEPHIAKVASPPACATADKAQVKLEEDFKSAQQLLEEREEELTQLTEEIEDGIHHGLPSETLHMQLAYQQLEEQLATVQLKYEEVMNEHMKCNAEVDNWNKKYQELSLEAEECKSNNESLKADIAKKEEIILKQEKDLQNTLQRFEEKSGRDSTLKKLQSELIILQKELESEKHVNTDLLQCLQRERIETEKLTTQLDAVHKEFDEKLLQMNGDKSALEQRYQKEITEMKDFYVAREKQICKDYEIQWAQQLGDLSSKFSREKEEAISNQAAYYEVALSDANKAREMLEKRLVRETSTSSNPEFAHLCDSLKDVSEGLRQELNKSGRLDESLVYFMRSGQERCESQQPSTRASSVVSDISGIEDPGDVENHLQELIRKIHQDGVQVLSLIERRFLKKHSSQLDSTTKSLLAPEDIESDFKNGSAASENMFATGERTQLLRQIAVLEDELSKKDREMRRQCTTNEVRLEQEKIISNEWKLSLESEKTRNKDLCEQLRCERNSNIDNVSEIAFLRSQLSVLRPQLKAIQEENYSVRENLESATKQLETLRTALQAERNNFSCVSKALNDQRNLVDSTKNHYTSTIKELQNALEKEREKTDILNKQLSLQKRLSKYDRKNKLSAATESEKTSFKSASKSENSKTLLDDLQMRLAVEQERVIELQRSYDRERGKIDSLSEQAGVERSRANIELMEEQARSAELMKRVQNIEMEKENLKRIMEQDKERLKQQELRIRELENELTKMDCEVRAQTAAHQIASHKVREDDAQLHLTYNQNLQKLAEAEAELCVLRQKIKLKDRDLEVAREKEKQLQEDLDRERMAINRLGLPALARSNNLNEYFELQVKENFELCKSVSRSIDERQNFCQKILSLEDKVTDLTQQLVREKAINSENLSKEHARKKECLAHEREISLLRKTVLQREAEIARFSRESNSRASTDINNCSSERAQHIYGENLRLKSRVKALVWQKQYLLSLIKSYQESEQHSSTRLHSMARRYGDNGSGAGAVAAVPSHERTHRKLKFRTIVLAVMALYRMQSMVQRWHHRRRIGSHTLYPYSLGFRTNVSSPDPTVTSRPGSSSSVGGVSQAGSEGARALDVIPRVQRGGAFVSVTGQTPPTKGPSSSSIPQVLQSTMPRRNLFMGQEPTICDEYIERLDSIHYRFGLQSKK